MEKLWFKIDSELNISSRSSKKYNNDNSSVNFYVFGDLIGSIINSKVYDSKDTINLLKNETFDIDIYVETLLVPAISFLKMIVTLGFTVRQHLLVYITSR